MTTAVVIVTLNRPDCVQKCLRCLCAQDPLPDQIIVVDASRDQLTRDVVSGFPGVLYLRNENGFGRMTASRNIGLKAARADIVAFVDDDAFAHEGWLQGLLDAYSDPKVGAVGGRALNNQPGEEKIGVESIGKLTINGAILGNFAADPGRVIDVDHIIGCNMSFRREVLAQLGGFREDYPGISGVREDSDMCLRVNLAGYLLRFTPHAVVTHIGAPQAIGRRFDWRYTYYASHNHIIMLIRNFGLGDRIVWRNLLWHLSETLKDSAKKMASTVFRSFCSLSGLTIGSMVGTWIVLTKGRSPHRTDELGLELANQVALHNSDSDRMSDSAVNM